MEEGDVDVMLMVLVGFWLVERVSSETQVSIRFHPHCLFGVVHEFSNHRYTMQQQANTRERSSVCGCGCTNLCV